MVVFFDIDGTVVDYETQIIPESAAEAIRLLKKNGHLPIVNTGLQLLAGFFAVNDHFCHNVRSSNQSVTMARTSSCLTNL